MRRKKGVDEKPMKFRAVGFPRGDAPMPPDQKTGGDVAIIPLRNSAKPSKAVTAGAVASNQARRTSWCATSSVRWRPFSGSVVSELPALQPRFAAPGPGQVPARLQQPAACRVIRFVTKASRHRNSPVTISFYPCRGKSGAARAANSKRNSDVRQQSRRRCRKLSR
jgi:hypothetical protein